jgi:hypothetical protein
VQSAAIGELVRLIRGLGFADLGVRSTWALPNIPGLTAPIPGFIPGIFRLWAGGRGTGREAIT